MDKRELWLDYVRAFACILVAVGHLFMSFQDASIQDGTLISFFIHTIYFFHVYLFFFCSGYLFEKSFSHISDRQIYIKKKIIRCIDFLIVYVIFSAITYCIKVLLANNVNTPVEHSFLQTLLKFPINQMWYLYAISIITVFSPVIKSKHDAITLLLICLFLKLFFSVSTLCEYIHVPIKYLFDNQIWFVLGSIWAYTKMQLRKTVIIGFSVVFILLSCVTYISQTESNLLTMLLTFTGVVTFVELFRIIAANKQKLPLVFSLVAKYMLQIYLLHTICAAGIRIILLKLGITHFWIHLPLGLLFSIVVPIICAIIAERTNILNVFFYPSKTINKYRRKT